MKQIFSIILCVAFFINLRAQVLYGTTSAGGANGGGTICKLENGKLSAAFSFDTPDASKPQYSGFVQASNGKLYSMTAYGGKHDAGIIFSYNPSSHEYTKLFDFDNTNGALPFGSLIQAKDGKLYGMTTYGGKNAFGVIFSYDRGTAIYKIIFEFDVANRQTTGIDPRGSLIQASNGKLYGMTAEGGSGFFYGVLFSFDINANVYTKLKDFDYNSGYIPYGTLTQAVDGKLYGATQFGASNIFSFDIANNIFTGLKTFNAIDGVGPCDRMIQASDGKLYGMTSNGGSYDFGVAYSFDPSTNTYTKLQDFNGVNGSFPTYTFFTEVSPSVSIKINNATTPEGNSGTTNISFTVTLSQAAAQTVTVDYKTKNNTAIAPSDYTAKTGTLTFAPGVKKQTISIAIKGDVLVENDEKFKVILSNAVGATIADSLGVGAIQNDDAGFTASTTFKMAIDQPLMIVSPNPATDVLQVQLSGYSNLVTLQLTDIQGKVLKEDKVQAAYSKPAKLAMNIADLSNGTYLLVASDKKGK